MTTVGLKRTSSDEWYTPTGITAALGHFDLDPCAAPRPHPTHADNNWRECGLTRDWERSFVFCNPPYSDVKTWASKMADHNNGILLVFARTETKWFQQYVLKRATLVLWLAERIHFVNDSNPSGARSHAPSVIAAYGNKAAARLLQSKLTGVITGPGIECGRDETAR